MSQKTRKRHKRSDVALVYSGTFYGLSTASVFQALSPALPLTWKVCQSQTAFHQASPHPSQLHVQQRKAVPAFPPAKCHRGPGRWRPCNPFSQTAAFGQTPTELLSLKLQSWPGYQNRPFSTYAGHSWPPRFCAGHWLDFLCEEKERQRWGQVELQCVPAAHHKVKQTPHQGAGLAWSHNLRDSLTAGLLLCPTLQGHNTPVHLQGQGLQITPQADLRDSCPLNP